LSSRARVVFALGFSLVAAGCSSAPRSVVPAAVPGTAQIAPHLVVRIPWTRRSDRRPARRGLAHQHFISASTQGLQIDVYRHGSRGTPVARSFANVSASSPHCEASAKGRVCALALPALKPAIPYDFVVENYDRPPSGNGFPAGASRLGWGQASATLVAGKANLIDVTIGGVVANLSFAALEAVHAIAPSSQTATVAALDPDGNVIVSDAFVDASGNPVSVELSADSAANGTVSFTPAAFSSPPPSITVAYSPSAAQLAQIANGFSSVLTASTGSGIPSSSSTLTVQAPAVEQQSVPTSASAPAGIASGPDAAMWFTESGASNIGRIDAEMDVSEFPVPTARSNPRQIVAGSDGALWFTECAAGKIGRIPTYASPGSGSTITEYSTAAAGSVPQGIALGSDGALWFVQCAAAVNAIGRVTTAGAPLKEFPIPTAASQSLGIVSGPDGALWFTESASDKIGRLTTGGNFQEFAIPTHGAAPAGIVSGPDGALWFTECAANKIGRIPTSGSPITEYPIPTASARPVGIAAGADGALWFTESAADKIGRIPTAATNGSSAQIIEFSAAGSPYGIAAGAGGTLWFTEISGNAIGRLQ